MDSAPGSDATSLSLLERAKGKDPDAWRRLVRLFAPLVSYWCRKNKDGDFDLTDASTVGFGLGPGDTAILGWVIVKTGGFDDATVNVNPLLVVEV